MLPTDRRVGTKDRRVNGSLSPMEIKVLALYANLGSQQEVADALEIKLQTVKNHLSSIYKKLGVSSAISAFKRMGWLAVVDVDNLVDNSPAEGVDNPHQ